MNRQQSYRLGGRGRGGCPGGLAAGGEGAEQLVEEAPAGGRGDRQRGGGGDGEDGGDPGEAEEGLERGPASRLHSNAATQRGGGGDWRAGRGLRKRRRGAAEARDPCGRRGFGFVLWTRNCSRGGGKANLEDARNSLDSLVRFLPVAGRF